MIYVNFKKEINAAKLLYPNLSKAGLIKIIALRIKKRLFLNTAEMEDLIEELKDRLN